MREPRHFKYSGGVSKRRHLRLTADALTPYAGSALPPVTSASIHAKPLWITRMRYYGFLSPTFGVPREEIKARVERAIFAAANSRGAAVDAQLRR